MRTTVPRRELELAARCASAIGHLAATITEDEAQSPVRQARAIGRYAVILQLVCARPFPERPPSPFVEVCAAAVQSCRDPVRVVVDDRLSCARALCVAPTAAAALLGELLDNALVFSPPDRAVSVRFEAIRGGCAVQVVDRGVGFSSDQLASAREVLAGAIPPGRPVGLLAVSVLSRRLSAPVLLSAGAETVVSVRFPSG